ncbi:MAG: hypothetical protein U0169_20645 [Polyangiaceae bacterium]
MTTSIARLPSAVPTASPFRTDVTVTPSAPRPTPGRVTFGEVMRAQGASLARGATSAITLLPGSPLLSMAVRGSTSAAVAGRSPLPAPGNFGGGAVAPFERRAEGPGTGAPSGAMPGDAGVEGSLQNAQEMNLYYLQVQEQVNAQNRTFSTLSNVLKAQHDTVKTAIGNIR